MLSKPGWILHTHALNQIDKFDFTPWSSQGFTNICRLNWGYGDAGTIPRKEDGYVNFAMRFIQFVANSPGCDLYILGNEPNHSQERPGGIPILPEHYAECFNVTYANLKNRAPNAKLIVGAVAPWNQETGDWLTYWKSVLDKITDCDGLALHAYTHGPSPALIWDESQVNGWYWNFAVFRNTLAAVPDKFQTKPTYITEADQNDPWANNDSGWVREAHRYVDVWNLTPGTQKVMSLILYRWQTLDQWGIQGKSGVESDFRKAVAQGYKSPLPAGGTVTPPPDPGVPPQLVGTPDNRTFDPRLVTRGVKVLAAPPGAEGSKYWFAKSLVWLDEQQSQGRHHIYGNVYVDNAKKAGIKLKISWPDGSASVVTEDKSSDPPPFNYWYNYPMSASLNEFSIEVNNGDGIASEKVTGIGMGADGNSHLHTSTIVEWELRTRAAKPSTPTPTPPPTSGDKFILPVQGVVSQRWGENPDLYSQKFGIPYHNGLDIAAPLGAPIVACADGIVKFIGNDPDYGNYVRVYHPQFRLHTFMAHMTRIDVAAGQPVKQGDKLGTVGSTGNSTGPHCHLEIRLGTADTYAQGTFGHSNGRVDPQTVLYILSVI